MKKDEEKVLKWRLSEKPTVSGVNELLRSGIISPEEARQLVLEETTVKVSDIEDLRKEMELLRSLVLNLAAQRPTETVRIIREYIPTWKPLWSQPYMTYCSSTGGGLLGAGSSSTNAIGSGSSTASIN